MHAPFTAADVAAHCRRLKGRKAVAGSLPPWFLKAAGSHLAHVLAAQLNAWVRVGQLSAAEALSLIFPIPKPGAQPGSLDGLRGIAVGTLPAKLFATILEQRISDWAEASGSRAAGQFGFRRRRSTAQAALVLRTLQDQHRTSGQQLWACFVDFKKAYDSVPRARLWAKLRARGLGGSWLRAVQALYADVPMSVRTADGPSPCFQARLGLKQGCPLSPTLFGLYIDDFEAEVRAAAQRGEQLDLPVLWGSNSLVPPLLYADDMTLLATSREGLQRQLDLLQRYCQRWGLTVNTVKTKLMLLSGQRTQQAAQQAAEQAGLTFGGQPLEAVSSFKYLGITFHASTCFAGAAAPARTKAAWQALHNSRARCAALGIEAARVQLRLFSALVDSVLSCGTEVWGVQLAAKAAAGSGSTGCSAEKLHLSFLRNLLGVRQATPNGVVLAETGERPLWARWLQRAARLWNRALAEPQDSLLRQAVTASIALAAAPGTRQPARQPWAQQFAVAMAAVGLQVDMAAPRPFGRAAVRNACQQRQLELLQAAASRDGASKLLHYTQGVWGGNLDADSLALVAEYLTGVRERCRRQALAMLITGSHWGLEETGRWQQLPREQRPVTQRPSSPQAERGGTGGSGGHGGTGSEGGGGGDSGAGGGGGRLLALVNRDVGNAIAATGIVLTAVVGLFAVGKSLGRIEECIKANLNQAKDTVGELRGLEARQQEQLRGVEARLLEQLGGVEARQQEQLRGVEARLHAQLDSIQVHQGSMQTRLGRIEGGLAIAFLALWAY